VRCLVEASWGMGDVLQATPLCHALWLLGFDVDLLVSLPWLAPLFDGLPPIRRVLTDRAAVDFGGYDFAVSAFGDRHALARVAPGLCRDVTFRDVFSGGLLEANLRPARDLGYDGPVPPSLARAAAPPRDLRPRAVVVHAGCDPRARGKRWSGWPEICDRLAAAGHHVIVVGTEVDRSDTGWERRHDCRFGLALPELVALLAGAELYLGNDSGVGHLAAAAGTPGVLAFGPTDPEIYAPNSAALRRLAAPAHDGETRAPVVGRRVPIDRLDVETVWREVEAVARDRRRDPLRPLPARRPAPRGDLEARLPSPAEIRAVPPTLQATDALLARVFTAGVLGLVARGGDRRWRREVAIAAGHANLRAAEARRVDRTWRSHRKALRNLYLAWRAGLHVPSLAAGLALVATRRSRGAHWDDRTLD